MGINFILCALGVLFGADLPPSSRRARGDGVSATPVALINCNPVAEDQLANCDLPLVFPLTAFFPNATIKP